MIEYRILVQENSNPNCKTKYFPQWRDNNDLPGACKAWREIIVERETEGITQNYSLHEITAIHAINKMKLIHSNKITERIIEI